MGKRTNLDGHDQNSTHDIDPVDDEQQLLGEIQKALKSIRYGSIQLVIHDGRLVEITKTVRSRISSR